MKGRQFAAVAKRETARVQPGPYGSLSLSCKLRPGVFREPHESSDA
jgi:hypothetical protein